jgi:hypothetical protein
MKTKLKDILNLAILGLTLLATTTPTWAGRVTTNPVQIGSNQTSRYAYGSMASARYSADNKQSIQCRATVSTYPNGNTTVCSAVDSTGNYLLCGSQDPKLHEVVQGMTDSTYIYFAADLNGGNCSHIYTYHGSDMLR